jgi:hypothetical protein
VDRKGTSTDTISEVTDTSDSNPCMSYNRPQRS